MVDVAAAVGSLAAAVAAAAVAVVARVLDAMLLGGFLQWRSDWERPVAQPRLL